MTKFQPGISFVVPAYNEEGAVEATVRQLHDALSKSKLGFEIFVVDDGSTDGTAAAAKASGHAKLIYHPVNAGYGRAIKSGIEHSQYAWIGIVDADGTYPVENLPELIAMMEEGFDMAVGFRSNVAETVGATKNVFRRLMTGLLNLTLGAKIQDPNSGFRLFRRELTDMFGPFLCNTFSFTTSLTIFAVGHGHFVGYAPITYAERVGRSNVRHFRDSLRMIQLIMQGITFYNPMKFYLILVLFLLFLVVVPALGLYALKLPMVAIGYLILGAASALLIGMGMLGDINRISSGLRAFEIAPLRTDKEE